MTSNTMRYRGYVAAITYVADERRFYGDVLDLADAIAFSGSSVVELEEGFAAAVDAYLDWCAERGKEPAKPFSGRVLLRLTPDLHRAATLAAAAQRQSVNAYLVGCVERALVAEGVAAPVADGDARVAHGPR
ncbi:MAG: type II toxin-antitoxin system HicB family antitoxin [Trueperaceae bacterium]|nr:type II toxin-antitoxin system HicB family antitoxin [Trueperaceae bacterium]